MNGHLAMHRTPVTTRNEQQYTMAGPEGAPALVLLHGSRLTRAMWQPQIAMLSDALRVIAPDLPGHGALAQEPFSLDSAVRHVAAVVDATAGGRATICGLSMGGYVALAFAARHPERTTALVLSGCSYSFRGVPGRILGAPYALASHVMTGWFAPLLARADERMFRSRYPASLADPIIQGGFFYRPFPAIVAALRSFDPLPALRTYTGPALLLNGKADPIFRRGEQSYLHALARGRLHLIAGAAHLANLDQPEAYSAALRDFAISQQTHQAETSR